MQSKNENEKIILYFFLFYFLFITKLGEDCVTAAKNLI